MDVQKQKNSTCCLLKMCKKDDKDYHILAKEVTNAIEDAMKNTRFKSMSLFMSELATVTHILFQKSQNITIKAIPPFEEKNGRYIMVYDNVDSVDTYIFDTIMKSIKTIQENNTIDMKNNMHLKNYLYRCFLATRCCYLSSEKNENPNYFVMEFFSDPNTPNVTFKRDANSLGVDNINDMVSRKKDLKNIESEKIISWIGMVKPIFKSRLISNNRYYTLLIKVLSMIYESVIDIDVIPEFSTPEGSNDNIEFTVKIPFIIFYDSLVLFPIFDLAANEEFLCDIKIEFRNSAEPDKSNKMVNETYLNITIKKRTAKRSFI